MRKPKEPLSAQVPELSGPRLTRRLILFMDSNGAYLAHDYEPQMQLEGQVVEPVLQ